MIKSSILVSQLLPFQRLEYKVLFLLTIIVLIPLLMLWIQGISSLLPDFLVPEDSTIFWTSVILWLSASLLVYLLFRPISLMTRAVEHFHLSGDDPGLPSYYNDEIGRLLGNVQLLIRTANRQQKLLKAASMEEYLGEVFNRNWCERRLGGDLEQARFNHTQLSIGIIQLANYAYLKQDESLSTAQYVIDYLVNMARSNSPVDHWLARWGDGGLLLVLHTSPHEAEVIFNRIHSGIQSATVRTPMGHTLSIDMRQCLYHYDGSEDLKQVIKRLDAGYQALSDVSPNSRAVILGTDSEQA